MLSRILLEIKEQCSDTASMRAIPCFTCFRGDFAPVQSFASIRESMPPIVPYPAAYAAGSPVFLKPPSFSGR
jgi:hypothetical protein